jgi:hypothetical protein
MVHRERQEVTLHHRDRNDRRLNVSEPTVKAVAGIRAALELHSHSDCCDQVLAFLLHPETFTLVGVHDLWGIAVRPDLTVNRGHLALECLGNRVRVDRELDELINEATAD